MGCIISLACTCPSEPRQGTCPRKWGLVVGWKHFPMAQWERQVCVSSIRCCCSSLSPTWSLALHFGTTNHVCAPEQRRMVRLGLKLQVMITQHDHLSERIQVPCDCLLLFTVSWHQCHSHFQQYPTEPHMVCAKQPCLLCSLSAKEHG